MAAIVEIHAMRAGFAVDNFQCIFLRMRCDAQFFDFLTQDAAAALIHLHRHQTWCEFDYVSFQLHVTQRLGTLQSKQTAAYHHAAARPFAALQHRFQIFDGAINETILALVAGQGWHKRIGAGSDHQFVVIQRFNLAVDIERNSLGRAVDQLCLGVQLQFDMMVAFEKTGRHQRQVLRRFTGKEFRQMDTIISRTRFFAQHCDFDAWRAGIRQAFQEFMTDHAVTDNNDFHGVFL